MFIAFLSEIGELCAKTQIVRLARTACLSSLVAGLLLMTGPMVRAQDAPADLSLEQIDQALLVTYIHGITAEIALREVGVAGVPRILEHLADPDYARRDNLVAFLEYLAGPESRDALLETFTRRDLEMTVPEEDRARLMVPHALGRLASRGDDGSLELLLSISKGGSAAELLNRAADGYPEPYWGRVDLMESVLRGLAFSGSDKARERLRDIGRGQLDGIPPGRDLRGQALDLAEYMGDTGFASNDATSSHASGSGSTGPAVAGADGMGPDPLGTSRVEFGEHDDTGNDTGAETDDFDTQNWTHENRLNYANHIDLLSFDQMDDDLLDATFLEANRRAGGAHYTGDVACCATIRRVGPGLTFGFPGDGLDTINNSTEGNQVIGNGTARVKVVRYIGWCGSSGSNIIGCAYTPGWGMALVRVGGINVESVLWIHEYGHNTGLQHASDSRRIMYGTATGGNNGLSQAECNRYHTPASQAQAAISNIGACDDADGDTMHDILDNCPNDVNFSQSDSDADGAGNSCDNCLGLYNPDQENHDGDAFGDLCDDDDDNDGVPDVDDCAPINPFASQAPGEPFNLGWSAGATSTITWQNGPASFTSNVYRGAVDLGFASSWDCVNGSVFGTSFEDSEDPAPGEGFRYVLTGENTCGESSAGTDSDGAERLVDACP